MKERRVLQHSEIERLCVAYVTQLADTLAFYPPQVRPDLAISVASRLALDMGAGLKSPVLFTMT